MIAGSARTVEQVCATFPCSTLRNAAEQARWRSSQRSQQPATKKPHNLTTPTVQAAASSSLLLQLLQTCQPADAHDTAHGTAPCPLPLLKAHLAGAVAVRRAACSRPAPLLSGAVGGGGARSPGRTHPGCCAMTRSSTSASASSCLQTHVRRAGLAVASTRPDAQHLPRVQQHVWAWQLHDRS